jgi:hypothetical protein
MSRLEFDPITHEPFRQEPVPVESGTDVPKWDPLERGERPQMSAMGQEENGETGRAIVPMVGL